MEDEESDIVRVSRFKMPFECIVTTVEQIGTLFKCRAAFQQYMSMYLNYC